MLDILVEAVPLTKYCLQNERNGHDNQQNGQTHEHIGLGIVDAFFERLLLQLLQLLDELELGGIIIVLILLLLANSVRVFIIA